MVVLQEYLPEQASEEDLRRRVREVVAEFGAVEMKDLGKVMKTLIPEFRGRANNSVIKNLVAEQLEK